jgi:hypothetical protein
MRFWIVLALVFSLPAFCPAGVARQRPDAYPATYEGGNLPLKQHKLKATLGGGEVVFTEGRRRIAVPVKDISKISIGTGVHRRFGVGVLGVVPLVHLGATERHYVALTCTGGVRAEALLRMSGTEYKQFVAALEKLSGRKPVDTSRVPTVVHYAL